MFSGGFLAANTKTANGFDGIDSPSHGAQQNPKFAMAGRWRARHSVCRILTPELLFFLSHNADSKTDLAAENATVPF